MRHRLMLQDISTMSSDSASDTASSTASDSSVCRVDQGKVADAGNKPSDLESEPDHIMKCSIKKLDKRYKDDGSKVVEERKLSKVGPEKKDWWKLYAFCHMRSYQDDGGLRNIKLHVNAQPIKDLLKDVIGDYPSEPIDSHKCALSEPAECLFFYRKELEEEGTKRFKDDPESQSHLQLLLDYVDDEFEESFEAQKRVMDSDSKAIAYDDLWVLLRPGTVLYTQVLGQPRAFKLLSAQYYFGDEPHIYLACKHVDYDGDSFGTVSQGFRIPQYSGTYQIMNLNIMPLDFHDESDKIRKQLLDRGHRFEQYTGQQFREYKGVAVKRENCRYRRFNVNGRVMIDCKTYHRLDPDDSFTVRELTYSEAAKRERELQRYNDGAGATEGVDTLDALTDEDCIMTNATVRGYSFTEKRFLEFFVDNLSPVEWNSDCFDQLVLDAAPKRTVQALVATHAAKGSATSRGRMDDIVKGKGQGLVMVLHGPPGVGKTLTAECVAEYVKRPLYNVSSGDLGTDSTTLDQQLTRIMDMTSTWNAVLLIDEADVFLERRSLNNMQRNAMVSVFLRVLEYYSGILFCTTNRVATFDDAFKSRIHVPLRYAELSLASRVQIWRNFCARVPGGVDIDEPGLWALGQHRLNGRQIKNVVKAGESLAAFEGKKLDLEQLQQVTEIQAQFEKDLRDNHFYEDSWQ